MKKLISPAVALMLRVLLRVLLRVRYRITVTGLKELKSRPQDNRPLLFLPNHQALIDPVIVMSLLYKTFSPRPLVDQKQSDHPVAKYFMDMVNAIFIPDLNVGGRDGPEVRHAGGIRGQHQEQFARSS